MQSLDLKKKPIFKALAVTKLNSRVVSKIVCCAAYTLVVSDAWADMGPLVVVPIVGAILLQILLGAFLIIPARERGTRKKTFLIFTAVLAAPWIGTLATPADSLYHFVPLLVSIVAASIIFYWRRAIQP